MAVASTDGVASSMQGRPLLPIELVDPEARICPSAAADLQDALDRSDQSEVALVSVMGTTRVGKSWLSSYLAGEEGLFRSAPGMESTTRGAAVVVTEMEDFNQRFELTSRTADASLSLVLADLEGKGDRDLDHDFRLLLPFMLTSRAVVYVAKQGGAGRQAFLDEMNICVTLAKRLIPAEEEGDEGPLFGTLHVVVNSVTGPLKAAREEMQSWLVDERSSLRGTREQRDRIVTRNETREALRVAFQDIIFHPTPAPSDDSAWYDSDAGPFSGLTTRYQDAMKEFAAALQGSLRLPRHVGLLEVRPSQLVSLLQRTSDAAFENENIKVPSLVEALVEESLHKIHEEITSQLHIRLGELDGDIQQELDTRGAAGFDLEGIKESHDRLKKERLDMAKTQLAAASVPASRAATALAEFEREVDRRLTQHHETVKTKISLKRAAEAVEVAEIAANVWKEEAAAASRARGEAEDRAQQAEANLAEAKKSSEAAAAETRKVVEQLCHEREDMRRRLREAEALAAMQPQVTVTPQPQSMLEMCGADSYPLRSDSNARLPRILNRWARLHLNLSLMPYAFSPHL
jgi:hypothetical protein